MAGGVVRSCVALVAFVFSLSRPSEGGEFDDKKKGDGLVAAAATA